MYIIALLLIPLVFILVLVLVVGIIAFSKIMQLWYAITGRKPRSSSNFSYHSYGFGKSNNSKDEEKKKDSVSGSQSKKKIFSKDEGEYVDFEIVE